MAITTAIAIYFLIWWITLFAVLPFGVRAQGDDSPPGTDPGAPQAPRLLIKLVWTTVVATVVFCALAYVYISGLVGLDDLAGLMGMRR